MSEEFRMTAEEWRFLRAHLHTSTERYTNAGRADLALYLTKIAAKMPFYVTANDAIPDGPSW